jgi:NAD(P)H dehydrogenase (quinone)
MKHAVIFSHPRESSFTASVAAAYREAAEGLGHHVAVRDLYRIKFDPCLTPEEIPGPQSAVPVPIAAERGLIADADVFVFVYPLWLNAPPAMIKGYMERVFGFGFAYGAGGRSTTRLLKGRKLVSISSSGAPLQWVQENGYFGAIRQLYDGYLAELCGFTPLQHLHFGNVVPGATSDFVQARLAEVRQLVRHHFA